MCTTPLVQQNARVLVEERQRQAEADGRTRRLLTVRRWQRRVQTADRQARRARLALQQG